MDTEKIKEFIEKAINTWNASPEVEQWLNLEEQAWSLSEPPTNVSDHDEVRYSFRLIINTQQVIYQGKSQALANLKTPMFMNEWRGTTTPERARERTYQELFENLILHGFTSGVKSLEFIRKHKALV